MNIDLSLNFKFNYVKDLFDKKYFICLYDKQDNFITSFDNIQESARFLNKPIWRILENLRRGIGITYNHRYCKLICIEKDNEEDFDLYERGKSL